MIKATPPVEAKNLDEAFCPSLKNPAVALCTEVWLKIHAATRNKTRCLYTAERCAAKAYRTALPPLDGYQNICDFIACVSYGMLLGAIKNDSGSKLLYAAQVALAADKKGKTQTTSPNS